MFITAKELCNLLGGELEGDPDVEVHSPSKIEEAEAGTLSFLANPKYEAYAYSTKASVLLVGKDFKPEKPVSPTLIRVNDVYSSLGQLLEHFNHREKAISGVSQKASVDPSAQIGANSAIGDFTVVMAGVEIGEDCQIYPQVYLGHNVQIGSGVKIFPGVRIYHDCVVGDHCIIHANAVIGSDGFGYSRNEAGEYTKIAQIGNVVLENHVEVGAHTTIDRATMGSTRIRQGAKLDNLIQIAHNVDIGENTAIAAQAGVAGSSRIGKNVLIGGQAGIVGHITVPDGAQIQAQSGVTATEDEKGKRLYGSPALEYMQYLKSYAVFKNLPGLKQKVDELEKLFNELKQKS